MPELTHLDEAGHAHMVPRTVRVRARVRCDWRTGVEMGAPTAVSAALLTVYDMVKAIDKGPEIGASRLLEKRGGRSGTWVREQTG